jgi:hypothetical protein
VAAAMARGIERASARGLHIRVQVQPPDGGTLVRLEQIADGSRGNQPIIDSVQSNGLVVTGMSGGAGHDCPPETGCTRDEDCAGDNRDIGECVKEHGLQVGRCRVRSRRD